MNPTQTRQRNISKLLTWHLKELQTADYEAQLKLIMQVVPCARQTAKEYRDTILPYIEGYTKAPTPESVVHDDHLERYFATINTDSDSSP